MTDVALNRGTRRRTSWLLPGVWLVLTIALVAALPFLPWRRAVAEVHRAEVRWLFAALLANFAILPLWAAEWTLLAPAISRVPYRRMFEVVAGTGAVLNSIPFFAGELSAIGLLMSRAGLSSSAALSVLAMDQLIVGVGKLAVLGAAAFSAPLPPWLRGGIMTLALGVAGLLLALVPLANRWDRVHTRLVARQSRVRDVLAHIALWGAHLDALRDGRRAWRVVLLALAKKAAEVLAVIAVQIAFGNEPSVSAALLVVASLGVVTALPVAPANLGVYEATVFAIYRYLGAASETALSLAVVQHACFLLPPLATGYATLTLAQLTSRRARA